MRKNFNKKSSQIDKLVYLVIGISFLTVMIGGLALLPSSSNFLKKIVGETEFPVVVFEELTVGEYEDYYVVCPEFVCIDDTIDQISPRYNATATQMRNRLLAFVDNRPNITLKNLDLGLQQFDFTENIPESSFPDIITVRIVDNGDGTTSLAIYSRSVMGDGAIGNNQKRVENWLLVFDRLK